MLRPVFILFTLSAAAGVLWAGDESYPPGVYKSAGELMAALSKSAEKNPDQPSAPVSNQDHYRINVVRRTKPGPAMAHLTGPAKGTEVHYIIDGAATVVTGGTLNRPAGTAAKGASNSSITGGETRHVSKGDVIVIPAGTPHWYKEVEGSVTYLEVRFDVELGK